MTTVIGLSLHVTDRVIIGFVGGRLPCLVLIIMFIDKIAEIYTGSLGRRHGQTY